MPNTPLTPTRTRRSAATPHVTLRAAPRSAPRATPQPRQPIGLTPTAARPSHSPAQPAQPAPSAPPNDATRRRRLPAPGPDSHDRIFTAALAEFAARGVAGARVDRIAASAGLNKAMLYYHFGSKDRLYRAVIQHVVGRLASSLEAVAASNHDPAAKLDLYIETFVRLGLTEPHFAPLMLREVAEGASRVDEDTVAVLLRLVGAMGAILSEGHRAGVFREADALLTYLTTAWPILVYLSTDALRRTIVRHARFDVTGLDADHFIHHMQNLNRRALAIDTNRPATNLRATSRTPEHAS
jgi:AcrR family transcriptional regulator